VTFIVLIKNMLDNGIFMLSNGFHVITYNDQGTIALSSPLTLM